MMRKAALASLAIAALGLSGLAFSDTSANFAGLPGSPKGSGQALRLRSGQASSGAAAGSVRGSLPADLADAYAYPGRADYQASEARGRGGAFLEVSWQSWVFTGFPENDRARAFYFAPKGEGRRPAILLLHTLGTKYARDEQALCRHLAAHGIGAMLLVLPFHMRRAPAGTESGALMFGRRMRYTAQAFRQAVIDARTAADWLEMRPELDPERMGIVGISLGAVISPIALAVEPRFKVGVLVLGGGDLRRISREGLSVLKFGWKASSAAELERQIRYMEPLEFAPYASEKKIFMINARYDLLIPKKSAEALWEAFGKPKIVWLDTGHYGVRLGKRGVYSAVESFLATSFGLRSEPLPPVRVPGVHFGIAWAGEGQARVFAGLHLRRIGSRGDLNISLGNRGVSVDLVVNVAPALIAGATVYRWHGDTKVSPMAGLQFTF
jgi:dienelactone hydrolase